MRSPKLNPLWFLFAVLLCSSTVAQPGAQSGREGFYEAMTALRNQEWSRAAELYRRVLETPEAKRYHEEALFWSAYCEQQLHQYERAIQDYARYLSEYPSGRFQALVEARLRTLASRLGAEEEIQRRISEALTQVEKRARRSAVLSLTRSPSFQDLPLIIELLDKERDPSLRTVLITSLGQIQDPQVIPKLETIARTDTSLRARIAAIEALSRIRDRSAALTVVNLVQVEQSPEFLRRAVPSLARFDADVVVPVLLSLARRTDDPRLRDLAVSTISRVNGAEAYLDSLYTLALEAEPSSPLLTSSVGSLVRLSARPEARRYWDQYKVEELAHISLRDTTGRTFQVYAGLLNVVEEDVWRDVSPLFFELVRDGSRPRVAGAALQAFRRRGFGKVPPSRFVQLLSDPALERRVAQQVLDVLAAHSEEEARAGLTALIEARRPAVDLAYYVGGLKPEVALPVLEGELDSDDPGWRAMVVRALGRLGVRSDEAVDRLIEVVEGDPDPTVRREAFEQLTRLNDSRAKDAVLRLIHEFYR